MLESSSEIRARKTYECVKAAYSWMIENGVSVNGDQALNAARALVAGLTDSFYESLKNGKLTDKDYEIYCAALLMTKVVETVVEDEGSDEVELGAETYDDYIRRKAEEEVREMEDQNDG